MGVFAIEKLFRVPGFGEPDFEGTANIDEPDRSDDLPIALPRRGRNERDDRVEDVRARDACGDGPPTEQEREVETTLSETLSAEMARVAADIVGMAHQEARRILGILEGECRRVIQETGQQSAQILSAAERDAAKIRQAALAETAGLVAEAQKWAEEAQLAAKQAQAALRAVEALGTTAGRGGSGHEGNVAHEGEAAEPDSSHPPLADRGDGASEPEATSSRERAGISASGMPAAATSVAVGSEDRSTDAAFGEVPQLLSSITLVVSPFGSFRSLMTFQKAVEELDGVRSAKVRRFHKGTLYEVVQYVGVIPLEERLKELVQFEPRVVAVRNGTIELRIASGVGGVLEASTAD